MEYAIVFAEAIRMEFVMCLVYTYTSAWTHLTTNAMCCVYH